MIDDRYSIAREFVGKPIAQYVVRFCDKYVDSFHRLADAKRCAEIHRGIFLHHIKTGGSLPEFITARRQPTKAEIKFGHGAIHWADIDAREWIKADGTFKKFIVSKIDGLRYYR